MEITPVLDGDYSSTWPRLLQYLMEITAVLGPSTGAHILREEPYALVVLANSNNLVGQWPPCHVLHVGTYFGCWRTGHGGPCPTFYIPSLLFVLGVVKP